MTPAPQERCNHYDVCWFVCNHNKCINDNPDDIPCIFDTRKGVNFTLYIGRGDIALTEIEIALRKEESPSDNVQWAIERINRLQKEWDASHSSAQSERDKVLVLSYVVKKPGFDSIKRRELAYNDIGEKSDDFTRLHIPVETGDEIRIYRTQGSREP